MASSVDIRVLSAFSSIPEGAISNLLQAPTAELVKSLLENITTKAQECEQTKTQKLRLEVELEQSIRTRESKIKVFRNSAEKSLAEASKLRVELQQSENARSQLQSEIEQTRSSTSQDASQTAILQSRISSLESSNRDTVVLLESKTTAYEKLAQDLSAQHQKAIELRKQIVSLEQNVQSANTAAGSSKFNEQRLEQELDQAKKNNEWLDTELKTKLAEHTKFRKEKNARISELTRSNEQYISEAEALRRSESALKNRLEEQIQKFEENLEEIQQLREQKIIDAEAFRVDLESAGRLADLQKSSADTARERIQELTLSLEDARESFAEQLGQARAETDTERKDKELAEQRIAELESKIEQLESDLEDTHTRPTTPQRGINGAGISTPLRPGTPAGIFSPASATRLKGNLSLTQMYASYEKLERDYVNERRAKEQLQASLEEMVDTLESSKPEIEELRADHERQQQELVEMSATVENVNQEREAARKEARNYQSQVESQAQEIKLLKQQIRDGAAQVRVLLAEQHIRDSGATLSAEDVEQLRQAAVVQDVSDLSPTGRVISENLATFKTIAELQDQNEKIRSMLRQLGEKMESNESKEKEQNQRKQQQELLDVQAQNASLLDQLTTLKNQMKSHLKEREMFRGMMNRRSIPHVDPNDFSRSMPIPGGGSPMRGLDESVHGSTTAGDSDYAKLLKDLQTHFDTYREEAATDHKTMRDQIEALTKRNAQLQTEVARLTSQLSGATQQREMLQANFTMLQAQNAETQKRSEAAMATATRQEMKTQQAAEELIEAKGLLDSMRRESANLKAEKDLWKTVERRLLDDCDSLRNERSRLDQLNGSLQSLLNEREQSDGETRRRLQSQADSLESELQIAKRKLNDEIEENKKTTQRREFEHEQSQKRIDDLVTSLGSIREEFAATKSSRDYLQTRVDELTVELRSAEERVAVLSQPIPDPTAEMNGADESSISREQELSVEISELKRDLELKMSELSRAVENVEVYKGISQAAEESLQQLSETNDQYREETDVAIAAKDEKIKDLEQRIEEISSELNTTNSELSQLRDEQSESTRKLDEQKTSLESEISRLKEEVDRNIEKAEFNIEAAKAQQHIAEEYQQNYETELVKHAEAAKSLHTIRAEANQLKLEVVNLKTQVETAQTSLSQKEESWAELKSRYERELTDLKTRREEVMQQNGILHSQLETLTKQIASVQRDRAATAESSVGADGVANDGADSSREEMLEIVTFLRREKDIVDVQYHLSSQEAKRLRQQLDSVQSQLDDTRLKLDQQRRSEADTERNALNHNKLMETLNELNLYRESSVTLRAEAKQASQSLMEKTRRVEELVVQMEPLQTRIAELENLSELRKGEMKLLQQDRDHWQQRTQNILSKYDRVDPAELESLRGRLATLETERDEAIAAESALRIQVDGIPEQLESARQELRSRLAEQFKARSKELSGKIKDKQTEVDTAVSEKGVLEAELEAAKAELGQIRSQAVTTSPVVVNGVQEISTEPKSTAVSNGATDSTGRIAELEERVVQLEASVAEKEQELQNLKSEQDSKFKNREAELKLMLNKRLNEVKTEANAAKADALKELEERLQTEHQRQLDSLRSQPAPITNELHKSSEGTAPPTPTTAVSKNGETEELPVLTEAQARQLAQTNEVVRRILTTNIRKRVEHRESELRAEFEEKLAAMSATTQPENAAELEKKFSSEKEALIKAKEEQFSTERQALVKQYEDKIASEKQSLIIQHQEQRALEKLTFDKESEKKIMDQVALAEKRVSVKFNMADNRAKQAQAKVDVVRQAAEETPQKPVIEVWEIAKNAKPPPAQPKPAAAPSTPAPSSNQTAPSSAQRSSSPSKAAPPATDNQPRPTTVNNQEAATNAISNGPAKPLQNNAGTGPAALRQISGLPQPRGGSVRGRGGMNLAGQGQSAGGQPQQGAAIRGSGIPQRGGAGRGRGIPRGGAQNLHTNIASAPTGPSTTAGSPSSAASLNPQATQFTPQSNNNKRAREDGEGGEAGNLGKRIRGASGSVSGGA